MNSPAQDTELQALIEQHGLAMSMLQVAHAMDKQVEAQKKLNETKTGGLNAQQKAALGYQTTDIITSLAGGQNPMLVLIQQGGQLRDQFGGFGPLFKGIAEAVTFSRVAMVGLAGGIGAVVFAVYEGQAALKEFNNQILLSGNLANQTYDKYIKASHALAESQNVSVKTAKDAYSAVAASGQFTEKSILSVSTAIAAFARTAGVSGADAAQKLIPAFSGGASAIQKLNAEYNFLNREQARYIRLATLDPSNVEMSLKAIEMASSALTKQVNESKNNLGYFEKLANYASNLFQTFKEWGATNNLKDIQLLTKELQRLEDVGSGKVQGNKVNIDKKIQAKKEELKRLQDIVDADEERNRKKAEENEKVRQDKARSDQAGGPEAGVSKEYDLKREKIRLLFEQNVLGVNELKRIELEAIRDIDLAKTTAAQKSKKEGSEYSVLNNQLLQVEIEKIQSQAALKKRELEKKGREKDLQLEALKSEAEFQNAVFNLDKFQRIDLETTRDIALKTAEIKKQNIDEVNLYAKKNADYLAEYEVTRKAKAESDKREIARQSFEEVRKGIQTQQNSVDLEREKLAIYEKNFLISDADYKIELLKLETKQKIKEIDDNKNLDEAKKQEARNMVLELQRSKVAVDQLDTRLKMLKDSGAFVFKSMEDAIIQFTRTGKLSFKDLVGTVIRGLLEIQIRAQSTKLFSMLGSFLAPAASGQFSLGAAGSSGLGLKMGSGIPQGMGLGGVGFGGEFADGGNPPVGMPSLVGENGPELFIPRQSGTIIPNSQLSSMGNQPQVIYNGPYIASMSAIDTQSAAQFLAKNKNSVWSANQSAARGLPTNR